MALGNNDNLRTVYLNVNGGKLVQRVQAETAGAQARITKEGKTVYELSYSFVSGHIKGIETKLHDSYGKFLRILLKDGEDSYVVEMKFNSGYSVSFLKTLPNLDIYAPVRLNPKETIEGDKRRGTLFVNQNGKALKHAFTKDNPNGMPDLKQVKVRGEIVWDDTDRMEFLSGVIEGINAELKAMQAYVSAQPASEATQPDLSTENVNKVAEKLPF